MKRKTFNKKQKELKEVQVAVDLFRKDPSKTFEELFKLDPFWEEEMEKIFTNAMLYEKGVFYINPEEILYTKTELKKIKKSRLGKLIE